MLGSFSAVLRTLGVSALLLGLLACNSGGGGSLKNPGPTGDFEITLGAVGTLIEGDEQALFIPVLMTRSNNYSGTVTLQLEGASVDDVANLTGRISSDALSPGNDSSGVLLELAIADLPLLPQSRRLTVIATDGTDEHRLQFDVPVEPVDAPDIYLLVGQSNMIGFSGDGTRDSGPGGLDESNPRILQLNASGNDQFNVFTSEEDFTDVASNVRAPAIVVAEDPLHVPRDAEGADGAAKSLDYIGLGLTFAKTALLNTSQDIILVPAAWSGSAFCANEPCVRALTLTGAVQSCARPMPTYRLSSVRYPAATTLPCSAKPSKRSILRTEMRLMSWHIPLCPTMTTLYPRAFPAATTAAFTSALMHCVRWGGVTMRHCYEHRRVRSVATWSSVTDRNFA